MKAKVGIGTYGLRWAIGTDSFCPPEPLSPRGVIRAAAELNADFVQFADNLPLDALAQGELDALRREASELGIGIEPGTGLDLRHTGDEAAAVHLRHYAKLAEALDSRVVRLSLSHDSLEDLRDAASRLFRAVGPAYSQSGTRIALENHFEVTSHQLLNLVALAPGIVAVCLDTANSIAVGEWPTETVSVLGERAVSLHLKDYRLTPHPEGLGVNVTGAAIGSGKQDVPAVLKTVFDTGARPTIAIEQWCPREDSVESTLDTERKWLDQGLRFVRSVLNSFDPTSAESTAT